LIRELKEENERLKKQLAEAGGPVKVVQEDGTELEEELDDVKARLEANQKAMEDMEKDWEQRLKEARETALIEENKRKEEE